MKDSHIHTTQGNQKEIGEEGGKAKWVEIPLIQQRNKTFPQISAWITNVVD